METPTAVVIDDDADTLHLIRGALEGDGFTVHTTAAGPEGLRAVRQHRPSLVIVPLNLPGLTGPEFIRQIRSFSNVPLMIISTSNALDDLEASFGAGADQYLIEPFGTAVLQAYAQALLRRPA